MITLILGNLIDTFVILLAVVINIIVGFIQELKTSKALGALQKIVITYVKVLREGQERKISTSELVPGDVVFLESGDKVPADLRLFKEHDLKVNEATLLSLIHI